MRCTHIARLVASASLLLYSISLPAKAAEDKPLLHVYATPSLAIPLAGVLREYSKNRNIAVSIECGPPEALVNNIVRGDAADLFLGESAESFMQLKHQGMIDVYSQSALLRNQLVLVGPAVEPPPATAAAMLAAYHARGILVYYLDPALSPQGHYAQQWLEAQPMETTSAVAATGVQELQAELDNGHAAVIYRTDTVRTRGRVVKMPIEGQTGPIIYQGAVVAGEYMKEARDLLRFLQNPAMVRYFTALDFLPLAPGETVPPDPAAEARPAEALPAEEEPRPL